MNNFRIRLGFLVLITAVVLWFSFLTFRPYLVPLFLALVLYIAFLPFHNHVEERIKNRPALAALFTLISIIALALIPLFVFGFLLFDDARNLYDYATSGALDQGFLGEVVNKAEIIIQGTIPGFSIDLGLYVRGGLEWTLNNVGYFFSGFARFFMGLIIMLLTLYYLLKDGHALKQKVLSLSPLKDEHDETVLDYVLKAVNSVVRGSLLIAIVQGLLTGIGFAFSGVGNPVLFGALGAVSSLIPGVGTALVVVPGILYVFFAFGLVKALILAVWGVVVIGSVDNFLRPFLFSKSVPIHPLLIFLSVLGGLSVFGLIGFIVGPVMLSLLHVLGSLYPKVLGTNQDNG